MRQFYIEIVRLPYNDKVSLSTKYTPFCFRYAYTQGEQKPTYNPKLKSRYKFDGDYEEYSYRNVG